MDYFELLFLIFKGACPTHPNGAPGLTVAYSDQKHLISANMHLFPNIQIKSRNFFYRHHLAVCHHRVLVTQAEEVWTFWVLSACYQVAMISLRQVVSVLIGLKKLGRWGTEWSLSSDHWL